MKCAAGLTAPSFSLDIQPDLQLNQAHEEVAQE